MSFQSHKCDHCGQTTDYDIALDRGSALIVMALANAVRRLGRNRVHVAEEMIGAHEGGHTVADMVEAGYMTTIMYSNTSRPRYHGLIAFVDKGSGEYLLTRKGADFLRGKPVPKTAIISKVNGHNTGYYAPDGEVTIFDLLTKDAAMWDGPRAAAAAYLEERPEMTAAML